MRPSGDFPSEFVSPRGIAQHLPPAAQPPQQETRSARRPPEGPSADVEGALPVAHVFAGMETIEELKAELQRTREDRDLLLSELQQAFALLVELQADETGGIHPCWVRN